jgi:hypothetical protein
LLSNFSLFEFCELLEHVIEDDRHAVVEQGLAKHDDVENFVYLTINFF